ncbi:MAG: parallel beta-helix repeat-containing protein, partial [Candidatus Magnetoglobus multicellularis str. Araruama]
YPNDSCKITVSYSATTIGNDQGLLTLFSNAVPSVYTLPIAASTQKRILRVGPTREFQWVRQVSEVVQDNDIIEIDAGLYPGDIASWEASNLIIRGIGGRAHLHASGRSAEGKAIWVIRGENTLVENIEFSNCEVEDRNGAGIRLEGNNLTLRNCYFHHNENGILTAIGLYNCELLIEGCEFAYNGNGNGLTHNMYINVMKRFTLIHSYSHHTLIGHNVKTRAYENHILYNRIMDEKIGQSSYLIDFSQGGKNIVMGNVFYQGRYAENNAMISHNAEYPYHSNQELYLVNNTFVNQKERNAIFVRVYNPTQNVVIGNNLFAGDADLLLSDDLDHIQTLHQQSNVIIPNITDAGFVNPDHFD